MAAARLAQIKLLANQNRRPPMVARKSLVTATTAKTTGPSGPSGPNGALVVGYTDGAMYMIAYFKRVLPALFRQLGRPVLFDANPSPARPPHVLLYSLFGDTHRKFVGRCRLVCLSGEPDDVSKRLCHALIDCKNMPSLRPPGATFAYLPFYVLSFGERWKNQPSDLLKPPGFPDEPLLASKTKFCAFLYSHDIGFRNRLFDQVCSYRPVDALGKCCHGRGTPHVPASTDRREYRPGVCSYNDLAVAKYRPYKFVIACENARQPGYVTEKIVSAMLAGAIPIYLGAPDVTEHFNPASFVNVAQFSSVAAAVERIKQLDQDPDAYAAMLREPWLPGNVLSRYFADSLWSPQTAARLFLPTGNAAAAMPPPPPKRAAPHPVSSTSPAAIRARLFARKRA